MLGENHSLLNDCQEYSESITMLTNEDKSLCNQGQSAPRVRH